MGIQVYKSLNQTHLFSVAQFCCDCDSWGSARSRYHHQVAVRVVLLERPSDSFTAEIEHIPTLMAWRTYFLIDNEILAILDIYLNFRRCCYIIKSIWIVYSTIQYIFLLMDFMPGFMHHQQSSGAPQIP